MPSFIKITVILLAMAIGSNLRAQPAASVLNSGYWYKFSVKGDGIYKIDYNLLKKAGFNPDQLDPRQLRLYASGNGMLPQANSDPRINALQELAIDVRGQDDGKFDKDDFILFFGQGPDNYQFNVQKNMFSYQNNLYADKNFYFLTVAGNTGKRMATAGNLGGGFPVINEYDDFGYYETEQYNILKSGRDWFGEQFDAKNEITVRFDLPGIVKNSQIKMVSAVMAVAYSASSSFKVFFNNHSLTEQAIEPIPNSQYTIKGRERTDTVTLNSNTVISDGQSAQDIKYQYVKATGISTGYLNYFLFSMKRKLSWYGSQNIVMASASLANPVSTFAVAEMPAEGGIWDVTNPFRARIQGNTLEGSNATFSVATDSLRKFVVYAADKFFAPTPEAEVSSQNLWTIETPDLVIVTHPDFKSEAMRLASHRQHHNNITVAVVTPEEIYNDYSGGKQDVTAIRDFIKNLYERPGSKVKNLLLFGRCSYDYKSRIFNNTNLVPTYESRNSLSPLETYSSDDYFAFLEPGEGTWSESPAVNSTMDIGVGRLSVKTSQQAKDVVDKLIEYDTEAKGFGAWRQDIIFVADDGDFSIHQSQADQLATKIDQDHPEFITKKIYVDAFKQVTKPSGQFSPDTYDAVSRAVQQGAMIMNFTGHGSEQVWMQEQVLNQVLVENMKNGPRYPLFVTATCEFGRHDDPFQTSSGELLLLQKEGGAIGLVSTARPVNSSTNFELNKAFYDALFTKSNGSYRDLGTIFRDTKNNSMSGTANRNFSLLGDPSATLAFPENIVQINEVKTAFNEPTIHALSTVTIKGEVQRANAKRSDFTGDADITVFDRSVGVTTLGDENPPFNFTAWSNIIFRGKASVINGNFQVEFVAPENIESDISAGKVTVYAENGEENASGSSAVNIGGAETVFPPDQSPPEIKLFIGDTTFINGAVASPNTILVAQLKDDHGIAISGYGADNNLIALLDDSLTFNLNDYYVARKDNYREGTATFPLSDLKKGKHHLVVQASDTYGNRTSAAVDFVVTDGDLVISEFYNYPNPFSSLTRSTILGFTHNRPGEDLEAELVIFDLSGQRVDSRHYIVSESFSHVTLAEWDGANIDGNKLGNGIYLGKLSVRSLLDGSKNEQFTKLIIVN